MFCLPCREHLGDVKTSVLCLARQQFEVIQVVIENVFVSVMNDFAGRQWPTELPFHDDAMSVSAIGLGVCFPFAFGFHLISANTAALPALADLMALVIAILCALGDATRDDRKSPSTNHAFEGDGHQTVSPHARRMYATPARWKGINSMPWGTGTSMAASTALEAS
jgi:hypothetical protein